MALRTESLSQSALKKLAEIYVQRLVRNAQYSPEAMPELTRRKEWQKANVWQAQEVISSIKELARKQLLASGYSTDIIYKILPNTAT